ncbi:nitrilase-related carbon-nitrogen hydrolase [Actinomycetospora termitidis]|uniref:Nitrilase-related carbon-nitrogen hydrolase n=1 Tax=Actinomycetospora termitidis TaxID=3053470 RepID=A0ABT7M5H9_9PSEU|nr:nitrilase-related carbon-nitrogen hydrolase [Actinomycetospora sp. Odt1-22]MDL5155914.1 nitrilase-related carbon-nitrogen hydrolase [Actinomycetospora sp. Odt1-22]
MRIAVWQARGPDDGARRLARAAAEAAAADADVLVTPELFSTGYGAPFGPADPALDRRLKLIAAEHDIALVASEPHGGRITAVVVGPDGELLGRYAKTHLWGPDERAAFVPGDGTPLLVDLAGLRCAVVICFDVEFPEVVRGVALAGAEVVLVPTALDDPAVATVLLPARAMENGVTIAYANQCGAPFCGSSLIAGPDGAVLARAGDGEELLVADVDRPEGLTDYLAARRPETYRW